MHNLTGNPANYVNSVPVPDDVTDDDTAASLEPGFQQLADNVASERADRGTSEAAISALIATLTGNMRIKYRVFTSTGTWVAPAGVTSIFVIACGGGGGGGSGASPGTATSISCPGGGGGGGALHRVMHAQVTPTTTYHPTIGAGGAGGAMVAAGTTTGNNGSSGGTSTFDADDGTKNFIGGSGGQGVTSFDGNLCFTYPGKPSRGTHPHFSIYGLGGTTVGFLASRCWCTGPGWGGYGANNLTEAVNFDMTFAESADVVSGTIGSGGQAGTPGTDASTHWGGGIGGGGGGGGFGTPPNGGNGGNGNNAGTAGNGTDGGDATANTGCGGGGGGAGGSGSVAGGSGGKGGAGGKGIMVLAWIDNS